MASQSVEPTTVRADAYGASQCQVLVIFPNPDVEGEGRPARRARFDIEHAERVVFKASGEHRIIVTWEFPPRQHYRPTETELAAKPTRRRIEHPKGAVLSPHINRLSILCETQRQDARAALEWLTFREQEIVHGERGSQAGSERAILG